MAEVDIRAVAKIAVVGTSRTNVPCVIALKYRIDDPLAVEMTVGADTSDDQVIWTFARELLREGAEGGGVPTSELGDVSLRRDGLGLVVCLRTSEGHADLIVPMIAVSQFLQRSDALVPPGTESLEEDLDDWIEGVLSE